MNSFFRRIHRKSHPIDEATRPLELDAALHAALDGERSRDDAAVQRVLSRDAAQAERFADISAAITQLEQPIRTPDLSKSILDAVEARRPFAMGPVVVDDEPAGSLGVRRGRKRLSGARFAIFGGALALLTVVVLLDRIPAPAGKSLRSVSRPATPTSIEPSIPRPIAATTPSVPAHAELSGNRPGPLRPDQAYTALTLGTHTSRYEINAPYIPGTPFTSLADAAPGGSLAGAFASDARPSPVSPPLFLRSAMPNARPTLTQAATLEDMLKADGDFWWRELWDDTKKLNKPAAP